MKIRSGTVQEAVELAKQIPDFSNPYNLNDPATPLPKLDHVLIAEHDGKPIGFRAGYRYSADTFAVWLAGVLTEYRKQGIGGSLYRAQKEWLKSAGYLYIRTHARNSNRVMLKILVDKGYQVIDVVRYGDTRRNKVVFLKNLWNSEVPMNTGSLIVGLLIEPVVRKDREMQAWLRDITISWLRFKYAGRIIEDASVEAILERACEAEYKYCLILTPGTIVSHAWELGLVRTIEDWADKHEFLVAGSVLQIDDAYPGISPQGLLVSLNRYRQLSAPFCGQRQTGWNFINAGLDAGIPVVRLPETITATFLNIEPENDRQSDCLKELWGEAISSESLNPVLLSAGQFKFLSGVQRQVQNCRQGIFVWNFESYDDVNVPPPDFKAPVSTICTVAAGLKTNWILETHGFDENTRLIYFDYSPEALEFKKLVHEEWDGQDYPEFLRFLFKKLKPGKAFYQLWGGFSPQDMAWDKVLDAWTRETARWGGEAVIQEHWRRARDLRIDYVLCNFLEDQGPVLDKLAQKPNSVIWWSNVYFTFYSNWFHSIDQRRKIYEAFIQRLTDRCPGTYIYGNDYNNIPISGITADEYSQIYFANEESYLEPRKIRS